MMAGEGAEGEEARPLDQWPPPASDLELTNKDGTSSRLLFLTVQYVNEEASNSYGTGLEGFAELEPRGVSVVSPLDPNLGSTGCYSPVYRPSSPLMPAPVSPTSSFLNPTSPVGGAENNMIVLSEPSEFSSSENFAARMFTHTPAPQPVTTVDDGKQLLLLTHAANPTELMVAGSSGCGEQRVELLLANGTIAYGIVESTDSTGAARVIQIPREYLVTAPPEPEPTQVESAPETTQVTTVDENSHLRALYNTLKEQGLIIEPGELRLEESVDSGQLQEIENSLLQQSRIEELQPQPQPQPQPVTYPSVPVQRRFWCVECNELLESDCCSEHLVSRKISDKAVPSRAHATLPASYLTICEIGGSDSEEFGVFARKNIPKRTQFGPIEGVIFKPGEGIDVDNSTLVLTVETESGEMNTLDVSNEHMSNWMRFVRVATPERPPNLLLSQLGASLFFTTTCNIPPQQELLVWYSTAYANRRGLPPYPPPLEFPCSVCGQKLSTAIELIKHSQSHQAQTLKEENLEVYSLQRENKATISSTKKEFDCEEKRLLTVPKQQLKLECPICKKLFLRVFSLKRHILLLHTRENKYHCRVCHLGFSHSYNRLRHMRRAHPKHKDAIPAKDKSRYEYWSCSRCILTFGRHSLLNLHKLVHDLEGDEEGGEEEEEAEFILPELNTGDQELTLECPDPTCNRKFSSKNSLARHVAEHAHSRRLRKLFHCHICGRNFVTSARFKIHNKVHTKDDNKPLQCEVCKKRFTNNSALIVHSKIHKEDVRWDCPICKQEFLSVVALKSHVHIHAVQGSFNCPYCNKGFDEYSAIRKHIRAFHSAYKFNCKHCGKGFMTQDKLRMHALSHSDHREFLCDDCGKQFKRKDKLVEHMRRIHLNKPARPSKPPPPLVDQQQLNKPPALLNASDYQRYIYKCHSCMLGFKRRGMLVNHLYNRHPDISPESVPELNLPILKTTRDYYCQYCDKIYKSSSKRKAHILKNHPGLDLPMSNRKMGGVPEIPGLLNPTFSQTVGSVTTDPQGCQWCHKQYASKAKLLQHQRKKHSTLLEEAQSLRPLKNLAPEDNIEKGMKLQRTSRIVKIEEVNNVAGSLNHPIMMSSNPNIQEYEIEAVDDDLGTNILIDTTTSLKRSSYKNDNISSDLLSQAMSEIGVSLSDFRALSSDQCFKLLHADALYTPFTPR